MARLIDADALKKAIPETTVDAFQNCRYCVLLDKEQVNNLIDAAPTIKIDRPTSSQFKRMAVQLGYEKVVHCKDCKHSWQDIGGLCCSHGVCVDCTVPEDFFCAHWERRADFVDDNKIGERRADENEPLGT